MFYSGPEGVNIDGGWGLLGFHRGALQHCFGPLLDLDVVTSGKEEAKKGSGK